MATKSLAAKLLIKPKQKVAIINAPEGYMEVLGEISEGVTIGHAFSADYDQVQLFVRTVSDLAAHGAKAIKAVREGGILWVAYPKKSGAIKTDISRDVGWEVMAQHDWLGVTQISIDDTWSALRFRPRAEIKTLTRKFE
jgi:hypothetical protein